MRVHAHPDRRAPLATAVQERARVMQCALDQCVGLTEVVRRHAQRTRRRQHDQLRVTTVALDVLDQPAVRQQTQRVQRHLERAAGRRRELTRVTGGQHIDPPRAERDGLGDRGVVRNAAVHEHALAPSDRW